MKKAELKHQGILIFEIFLNLSNEDNFIEMFAYYFFDFTNCEK